MNWDTWKNLFTRKKLIVITSSFLLFSNSASPNTLTVEKLLGTLKGKLVELLTHVQKLQSPLSTEPLFQPTSTLIDEILEQSLTSKNIAIWSLSNIIEQFLATKSTDEFITKMATQFKIEEQNRNEIRSKLAKKWVRNASSRIFHDYRRSFLELVVNSCDALLAMEQGHQSVGKFGMGFFSIFTFLTHEETKGTLIEIKTAYINEKGTRSAYKLLFKKNNDENIDVIMSALNQNEIQSRTGTHITIYPLAGRFSQETLEQIKYYIHYLDFYQPIKTILTIDNETIEIGKGTLGKTVEVSLNPDKLEVIDAGTGIPLPIAITKLLIPSSSIKGRSQYSDLRKEYLEASKIELAQLVDFKGKKKKNKSHILIEINGVIVVNKELKTVLYNQTGEPKDLLLSMPQVTQLTLARDEISFSNDEKNFEEMYLKKLIRQTIEENLLNFDEKSNDYMLLQALYTGLNGWEEQSAAHHIKGVFTGYFKEILQNILAQNTRILPSPPLYVSNLKKIVNSIEQNNTICLIPLSKELVNHNYSALEEYIKKIVTQKLNASTSNPTIDGVKKRGLEQQIIAGKFVYFVPEDTLPKTNTQKPILSSLGLRSSLFVPESLLNTIRSYESIGKSGFIIGEKIAEKSPETDFTVVKPNQDIQKSSSTTEGQLELIIPLGKPDESSSNFNEKSLYDLFEITKKHFMLFTQHDTPMLQEFWEKYKNFICNGFALNIFKKYVEINFFNEQIITIENLAEKIPAALNNKWYDLFADTFIEVDFNKRIYDNQAFILAEQLNTMNSFLVQQNQILKRTQKEVRSSIQLDSEFGAFYQSPLFKSPLYRLIQELKSFNKKNYKPNPEEIKGIKIPLEKIIHHLLNNNYFEKIPLHEFMNLIFGALLRHYGFQSYNNAYNTPINQLFLGTKQIFPLPVKNVQNVEDTFFILIHHSYSDRPHYYSDMGNALEKQRLEEIERSRNVKTFPIYFDIPGLKLSDIDHITTSNIGFDFAWSENLNKTLNYAVTGLTIPRSIKETLGWYTLAAINQEKETLSIDQKLQLEQMKESLFGLYNGYLTIPDDEFKRTYGENVEFKAQHPQPDVSASKIYALLLELRQDKELFKKLLAFQLQDFALQTNPHTRADDLAHNFLYIPTSVSNTPMSILASLLDKNSGIDVVKLILEQSKTPKELMYLSYILLQPQTIELLKSQKNSITDQKSKLLKALKLVITQYLQEKIDAERISEVYFKLRTKESLQKRIQSFTGDISAKLIHDFLNESVHEEPIFESKKEFLSQNIGQRLNNQQSFTLKQLIRAHCTGGGLKSLLESDNLQNALQIITTQSKELEIGKITQDIEAGSEKNPLEGVIIETLQNSVDAIKDFSKQVEQATPAYKNRLKKYSNNRNTLLDDLTSIRYKLETVPHSQKKDYQHLRLTIRDHAGMAELRILLTNFILPDYSEKSAATGNIGDMGNGSFKLYQRAQEATILTRPINKPEKAYMLHVTPLRNKDSNLVEDLQLKVAEVSSLIPQNFFGTSIKLLLESEHHDKIKMDLMYSKDFLVNAVGSTKIPLPLINKEVNVFLESGEIHKNKPKQRIHLNQDQINEKTTIFDYKKNYGSSLEKPLFRVYRRNKPLLQSYVTTGGIPFRPLNALARQMNLLPLNFIYHVGTGFIVDLDLSTYEPVQSRTQLQMTKENLTNIKKTLSEAFFVRGIQEGISDITFYEMNFLHYASRISDFHQLKLSSQSNQQFQQELSYFTFNQKTNQHFFMRDFFCFYKPLCTGNSFYSLINQTIDTLGKQLTARQKTASNNRNKALEAWVNQKILNNNNTLQKLEHMNTERDALITNLRNEMSQQVEIFKQQWIKERNTLFNTWKTSTLKSYQTKTFPAFYVENTSYGLIRNVVTSWLQRKIDTMELTPVNLNAFLPKNLQLKTSKELQQEQKLSQGIKSNLNWLNMQRKEFLLFNALDLLNALLNSYCFNFFRLINQSTKFSKGSFYFDSFSNTLGFYDNNNKELRINLTKLHITGLLKLCKHILKNDRTAILNNMSYLSLFAPKIGRTPTLIHELEHARRDSSHNTEEVHTDGDNPDGKRIGFDACANSYANLALQNGLIEQWIRDVQNDAKKYNVTIHTLSMIETSVENIENEDKNSLYSLMAPFSEEMKNIVLSEKKKQTALHPLHVLLALYSSQSSIKTLINKYDVNFESTIQSWLKPISNESHSTTNELMVDFIFEARDILSRAHRNNITPEGYVLALLGSTILREPKDYFNKKGLTFDIVLKTLKV